MHQLMYLAGGAHASRLVPLSSGTMLGPSTPCVCRWEHHDWEREHCTACGTAAVRADAERRDHHAQLPRSSQRRAAGKQHSASITAMIYMTTSSYRRHCCVTHCNKVLALLPRQVPDLDRNAGGVPWHAGIEEAFRSPARLSYLSMLRKFADIAMTWPEDLVLRHLQLHLWHFSAYLINKPSELDTDSTLRSTFIKHLLHVLPTLIRCASCISREGKHSVLVVLSSP